MSDQRLAIKNYLLLELFRNKLASEHNLKKLKKTYSVSNRGIPNPNNETFWDKKIILSEKMPDKTTEERISIVYKFIPKDAINMLDIGIGYGYLEYFLEKKKRNLNITGTDISRKAISKLKKRFNSLELKTSKVENITKKFGKFDVVVAMEIFEHILPYKTFSVLSSIKNILKNKGILIVSVPLLFNELRKKLTFPLDSSNHVRLYSEALILSELELAGFKIEKKEEIFAFNNYKLARKIFNLISKRWKPNILVIKACKK